MSGTTRTITEIFPTVLLGATSEERQAQLARLYDAVFDRAPDAQGLTFWLEGLNAGRFTLDAVADAFVGSAEFRNRFGTPSNNEFVSALYQNGLERDAEPAGLGYWAGRLDASIADRGATALAISDSWEARASALLGDGAGAGSGMGSGSGTASGGGNQAGAGGGGGTGPGTGTGTDGSQSGTGTNTGTGAGSGPGTGDGGPTTTANAGTDAAGSMTADASGAGTNGGSGSNSAPGVGTTASNPTTTVADGASQAAGAGVAGNGGASAGSGSGAGTGDQPAGSGEGVDGTVTAQGENQPSVASEAFSFVEIFRDPDGDLRTATVLGDPIPVGSEVVAIRPAADAEIPDAVVFYDDQPVAAQSVQADNAPFI